MAARERVRVRGSLTLAVRIKVLNCCTQLPVYGKMKCSEVCCAITKGGIKDIMVAVKHNNKRSQLESGAEVGDNLGLFSWHNKPRSP